MFFLLTRDGQCCQMNFIGAARSGPEKRQLSARPQPRKRQKNARKCSKFLRKDPPKENLHCILARNYTVHKAHLIYFVFL
jgi:hypothetical protein